MKKVLLVGNPNVGKSAIFSRLTGVRVVVSNYPGTTVEFTKGKSKILSEVVEVMDVPGMYSLEPTCKAEEVAATMLKDGDVIINVIDATNLERNLCLTLELIEKGYPVIVALNIWDETKHKGIFIDIKKLEMFLGVPVVSTCGLTGEGVRNLILRLKEVKGSEEKTTTSLKKWQKIGQIISESQQLTHKHHSFLEVLEDLSIKPFSGLLISVFVTICSFFIIRFIGEGLINYVLNPFFDKIWLPFISVLGNFLGEGSFLHYILIGNLINGQVDFGLSFGLLTTGLYVPVAMVLPYILSFYLVLGLLEDFGYLPRLAVLADNIMHRLGLHGYAIVTMILGFGCNVPGALAMRLLENRRDKFIAATLLSIAIPCMAQIAMIVGLLGPRGGGALLIVFMTLFTIWIVLGFIMNKVLKGETSPLILEIPPYRHPHIKAVVKKLWMRTGGFLVSAIPYVLLGILVVNILYALRIIELFSSIFAPFLKHIWGLPAGSISALLIGFLRKDVAVGMLGPLALTTKQLIIGCVILAIYFPCAATFVVLVKELGLKDMLKSALIMVFTAIIVGGFLNLIL
ncbi:MAG: ferrous iron transporter B [Candidatus Saelkia tenebricola]|nr:ferrous iron transporter B [Candidatus Saelkia tenebricola]